MVSLPTLVESPEGSPPPERATALLRRFLPYLWPSEQPHLKIRIASALFLLFAAKAVGLYMPFLYKRGIDALGGHANSSVLVAMALMGGYAAARFSQVLFEQTRNAVFEQVSQAAVRQLALDVFAHLHRQSLRYHLERRVGGLARNIERGVKSIDTMLYFMLFNIVPTIVELVVVALIFWNHIGWELVCATFVFVALYIAFTWIVTEWRRNLRAQMVESDTTASARAMDSLINYETVKYFNNEKLELEHYGMAMRRYEQATIRSENSLSLLNIGQSLITNTLLGAAMAWVVWGVTRHRYTIGDIILVNTLLNQLFRPLDLLGMVYREIKQGLIDMGMMFRLLDLPPEITDKPGARPLQPRGGAISFEHVDFAYEPSRPILHDVTITIAPGKSLAIVGASGAGKSTLSRILYRFYDVQKGRVLIDGQNIAEVTQDSLRKIIGIVPQDTVLFNESIAYNIGYGKPGASPSEIELAARKAQIHEFITRLPDGYDTIVGERGLKLSGGEKQRVAIARTILKDPPILILDEATSALDTRTERDIQDALQAVAENRTTLIIAHRLSTIVDADEIIVLAAGRIAERGTHAYLLKQNGLYAAMWEQQQDMPEAESALPLSDDRSAVTPLQQHSDHQHIVADL